MLQLKEYQERALEALRDYLRACVRLGDADTAFYETTKKWMGGGIPYRSVRELPGLPYVCLRIPTGGGKTLVACHGAGIAQRDLLQGDRSVVLWLVPSNAIRAQTLTALQRRRHPYRLALESGVGPVEVLDIAESLYVQRATLDAQTVVIVSTMQAFRVEDTEGRKVYEEAGALMDHFGGIPEHLFEGMEKREDGSVIPSLANVLRLRRPVVIVDEAHNARTPLSFDTLARFRPSCVLEFTATPDTERSPSNVVYSCSAAELKAEAMIKMPIRLETRTNWKELLSDAVAMRARLEMLAKEERRDTGEGLRPIMLLQAQPKRQGTETLSVEVVEKCLLEDFQIPKVQIARATAADNDLEGVDLSDPNCEIRYVITVQALREGWDCPWAYILCSVAEMHSSRAVEQILGRVLRLPDARWKKREELNHAYAFASSESFAEAANSLADALVENGFTRLEARDLIVPAEPEQTDMVGDLFSDEVTVTMPEMPDLDSLPEEVREVASFDANSGTMTVKGEMSEYVKAALQKALTSAAAKAVVEEACVRSHRLRWPTGSAKMKEKFAVPVLAIKVGDLIEQLEETHFLDCEWKLSKCDPLLTEEEFPTRRPEGKRGEIDITKGGQIETRFLSDLLGQVSFLGANEAWTEAELACWFDRTIPHRDITPTESGIFLARLVRALIDERRLSLAQLVLDKYRLRQAVEARIEKHRSAANRQAFQSLLFPEEDSAIMVTPERCFTYDPLQYAYSSIYRGSYKWQKHYYDQIGDLKAEGEEFECAVFLDQMPEVARWVRNLERRPSTSFWLPTSSGRFYPDFVCQLNDGRSLVVEYKGGHLWGDAKEKRDLGGVWGKRSGGRCLFIMLKEKNFDAIRAKIRSPKS